MRDDSPRAKANAKRMRASDCDFSGVKNKYNQKKRKKEEKKISLILNERETTIGESRQKQPKKAKDKYVEPRILSFPFFFLSFFFFFPSENFFFFFFFSFFFLFLLFGASWLPLKQLISCVLFFVWKRFLFYFIFLLTIFLFLFFLFFFPFFSFFKREFFFNFLLSLDRAHFGRTQEFSGKRKWVWSQGSQSNE